MKSISEKDCVLFRTNVCNMEKSKLDDSTKNVERNFKNPIQCDLKSSIANDLIDPAGQWSLMSDQFDDDSEALKPHVGLFIKSSPEETDRGYEGLKKKIQVLVHENLWLRQRAEKEFSTKYSSDLEKKCSENSIHVKLKEVTEENIRLRHILKDVTEVNKRWQKYNQNRQDYVQRLLNAIHDLEKKIQMQSKISEYTVNKNMGKHLFASHRHSDSDLLDPSGELAMLRQSHDQCLKENAYLLKENQEIHKNYEELMQQHIESEKQKKECEKILRLQANMFKEDFIAEQKEKLRAKAKVEELYAELNSLYTQLSKYKEIPESLKSSLPFFTKMSVGKRSSAPISEDYHKATLIKSKSKRHHFSVLDIETLPKTKSSGTKIDLESRHEQELTKGHSSSYRNDNVICSQCASLFHDEYLSCCHHFKDRNSC